MEDSAYGRPRAMSIHTAGGGGSDGEEDEDFSCSDGEGTSDFKVKKMTTTDEERLLRW